MSPRPSRGELFARKDKAWYNAESAPPGARWWYRIYLHGQRKSFSLNTTDKAEAIRRRDAWLAGLRLNSYEAFLQSLVEIGRRAERTLKNELAAKGVPHGK